MRQAWKLGDVVDGRYRLDSVLGRGGMGVVYRVTEAETQRALALKLILPQSADHLDLERFQREAEVTARLGDAGVVRVHSAGDHRSVPYYVMEFVEGEELETLCDRGLEPRRLATIVERCARTLHLCHSAGVVHRDFKPQNVLVQADDRPKIADFGLVHDRGAETLTQTGELLGTPCYMAPEQLHDARRVDARTDVYALGATLYRGMSGQPPYSGSVLAVLDALASRPPPPPSTLRGDVPLELEAICLRAMAREPSERYATAEALADDLQDFLDERFVAPTSRVAPRLLAVVGALLVAGLIARWTLSSPPATQARSPLASESSPAAAERVDLVQAFRRALEPEASAAPPRAVGEGALAAKRDAVAQVASAWSAALLRAVQEATGEAPRQLALLGAKLRAAPRLAEGGEVLGAVCAPAFAYLRPPEGAESSRVIQRLERVALLQQSLNRWSVAAPSWARAQAKALVHSGTLTHDLRPRIALACLYLDAAVSDSYALRRWVRWLDDKLRVHTGPLAEAPDTATYLRCARAFRNWLRCTRRDGPTSPEAPTLYAVLVRSLNEVAAADTLGLRFRQEALILRLDEQLGQGSRFEPAASPAEWRARASQVQAVFHALRRADSLSGTAARLGEVALKRAGARPAELLPYSVDMVRGLDGDVQTTLHSSGVLVYALVRVAEYAQRTGHDDEARAALDRARGLLEAGVLRADAARREVYSGRIRYHRMREEYAQAERILREFAREPAAAYRDSLVGEEAVQLAVDRRDPRAARARLEVFAGAHESPEARPAVQALRDKVQALEQR